MPASVWFIVFAGLCGALAWSEADSERYYTSGAFCGAAAVLLFACWGW